MKKITLLLLVLSWSLNLQAQSITLWTEENGVLGLGYPVPIPVNTTVPFDGFRQYASLLAKHQSLALNNPYISGHIVGQSHDERDIWAYVLSDEDGLTKYGVPEGAMLINGNIHAREWQSPEVLTGIMELLDEKSDDQSLHQYLLENTAIVAVPVNNVDGLLQTQRFPKHNWYSNQIGPRDGRMRRKNMRGVDEDLFTSNDFLLGVDLNRNNDPFWASSNSSSSSPSSIVYHGLSSQSEPETQARINAAALVNANQVRVYTDVHSFSQVHFSVRTTIQNRNTLQAQMLLDFTRHHAAYPAAKNYQDTPSGPSTGIGSTDEYFAFAFEVPSWTLEVEPRNGGVDYGGFGNNGHDGFILPDSEITRVREQLAASFMVAWYEQAGPPSITQMRIVETATDSVIYDANWDIQSDGSRLLFENKIENLMANKDYSLIISFDKPMRVRDDEGNVVHLQGQSFFDLNPVIKASLNEKLIDIGLINGRWIDEQEDHSRAFKNYKDDAFVVDFNLASALVLDGNSQLNWSIAVADMVGQNLDSDPATVVDWSQGQWQNYEDFNGVASIVGGEDLSYSTPVSELSIYAHRPAIQATALYFDPERSGEGFSYELLENESIWLQWFTYDNEGNQRWYSGVGEVHANKITVNNLKAANGGVFGTAFDAGLIGFETFGSLEIVFKGGESVIPAVGEHTVSRMANVLFTSVNGEKLRTNMRQLTFVKGALNLEESPSNNALFEDPTALISGSFYDPNRSGEGYILEVLESGDAVLLWYTYDTEGNLMWLIDTQGLVTQKGNGITIDFNTVAVTSGGIFGVDFDEELIFSTLWGSASFEFECRDNKISSGVVYYDSLLDGFGSGQYDVVKLTQPKLLNYSCEN